MTDREKLEWLWQNCNIVYFPHDGQYYCEHNARINKDCRRAIEKYMQGETPTPQDFFGS